MEYTYEFFEKSAQYVREKLDFQPEIGIILGSSLGPFAAQVENPVVIPYENIPNFLRSTVATHAGKLICGTVSGKKVVCMSGRFHSYEGYDFPQLTAPIRLFKLLGCRAVILTNAAGGVNLSFKPGDIMIINDQIMLPGCSPMRGPNIPEFGPRFFDVQKMYSPELRAIAKECAQGSGLTFHEGCYFFMQGPQFETAAEIRAIRTLGGDAVGMSTVTEALTAAHCGLPCLGFSVITNMAAGILDQPITPEGAYELAKCSRGTPRVANRFLKRVRDFATVLGDGIIDRDVSLMSLKRMDVDALGLDELDRSLLRAIIEMYNGGPVGLETLAAALGEEAVTLEDLCEPYLMQMGFLTRTPRGRCATRLAYEHLGLKAPESDSAEDNGQQSLF